MPAPPLPSPTEAITLTLISTPEGVVIRADCDLTAKSSPASVARTLCCFADGLFEGGQLVRLAPEIEWVTR